jgi:tetratricopeptide (TPR) repeat protein
MKMLSKLLVASLFFLHALSVSAACDDEAKKTDNWTKALADCQQATAANPTSNDARVWVIYYANRLRLWDVAIAEQLNIIVNEEKNPAYYMNGRYEDLAKLLAFKGDYENARLAYLKAAYLANDGEKYQVFAKALEANVKSGFKKVPDEKLDEKTLKADQIIIEQAADKSSAGKKQEAINDLNTLIIRRPNMQNAFAVRGIIHKDLSKFQESVKDFEMAVKLQPWESVFNSNLADAYTEINNREGCIEAASRVIVNHDSRQGDAFRQRAFCRYRNGEHQKSLEDHLQSSWLKNPNGDDVNSLALADYAVANHCAITNYDDIEGNFNKGNVYLDEKKYLCAVNFFETVIINPKVNSSVKATAQYNRALAYREMRTDSYAFSMQAVRDFNRAVASGKLDADFASQANYFAGEVLFETAVLLVTVNTTKIGLYEMAFPKLEIGVNTSNAVFKPTRTVELFFARCNYAKLLMETITAQKSKNRTEDVTKLTEKLNKTIPQIEAEYKTYRLNEEVKKIIETRYISFKNNYDNFNETK